MSTIELPRFAPAPATTASRAAPRVSVLRALLAALSSLRLTVTLLALSTLLVLVGTLAQIDRDVWYVIREYFRAWWTWIPLQLFLPRSLELPTWLGAPFPGGKSIGLALAINLVAAHGARFKVSARGSRLWLGIALVAAGAAFTCAVIASGSNLAGETELTASFSRGLWHALRALLGGAALTLAYGLALTRRQASRSQARWLWRLGAVAAAILLGVSIWLFTHPEARLDASGLRILWQLAKATGASVLLGLGCWTLFGRRAGIVLLHSGVGLLMFSELLTANHMVESQMRIAEGQTVNYAEDMRSTELAITDLSDPLHDRTTVVPSALLAAAAKSGDEIELAEPPLAVRVIKFLPNAVTRLRQPGETTLATAGLGRLRTADATAASTGVDRQQAFDIPAVYVELLEKQTGDRARPSSSETRADEQSAPAAARKSYGVYLLAPGRVGDAVEGAPGRLQAALRFKRIFKPYSLMLKDFKFDRYVGSQTPKNFESVLQLRDAARHVDVTRRVWMNNPLRYGSDTLYQADWDKETERGTVLQVMTNAGWMIPYVACMIVAAGMLVHFSQGIVRFVLRREDEARRAASADRLAGGDVADPRRPGVFARWRRPARWGPALVAAAFGAMVLSHALPHRESPIELHIREFGELPVVYGGRVQPLDALARTTLRTISGKESYDDAVLKSRQPAVRWLLDVAAQSPAFLNHKVIRVENNDVIETLGLTRREGFRYSAAELLHDVTGSDDGQLTRQARLAAQVPADERDLTQQKFLEANAKLQQIMLLRAAFSVPEFGQTAADLARNRAKIEAAIAQLNAAAPRMIPPAIPDGSWTTVFEASYNLVRDAVERRAQPSESNAASLAVRMLDAYRANEAAEFNSTLAEYRSLVGRLAAAEAKFEARLAAEGDASGRKSAEQLVLKRVAYEAWYNQFDPLFLCWILYLAAFALAATGWLGWFEGLNRSANWLLWLAFALHTFGLASRVYISGRPPITNIYSVAVFVGWAAVLFSLVFEAIYRLGLGNLMAAAMGFPTLVVAHYLSMDGDTLGVMQAVLDTNFWLATHVVCMNLGASTTLLAGGLGVMYLIGAELFRVWPEEHRRQLVRMIYGTLCFAIFFSFIGTILGGLWADDSWGRFWGWDPKENGALMIVLWNALALHARWGKMCGPRGLAALAAVGNIVTVWCLFGVNQMGVGLHSYGFIAGRSFLIGLFMASQLAVVAAAYAAAAWRGNRPPQQVAQPM